MRSAASRMAAAFVVTLAIAGCAGIMDPAPTPTPQPFPGIVGELGRVGVEALSWTAGDAGCGPERQRCRGAGRD